MAGKQPTGDYLFSHITSKSKQNGYIFFCHNIFLIHLSPPTGYFGKYLNDYFGDHTPPGWHRWMGLIRNSRFYNYSLVDETGRMEKHGDNYYSDYLTDLIARRGTAWLRESKMTRPTE